MPTSTRDTREGSHSPLQHGSAIDDLPGRAAVEPGTVSGMS